MLAEPGRVVWGGEWEGFSGCADRIMTIQV